MMAMKRILWGKPGDIPKGMICLSLNLHYVFCIEEECGGVFGLGGPKRIIVNLCPILPGKRPGPVASSPNHFIKLSFRDGIDTQFYRLLHDTVLERAWGTTILVIPLSNEATATSQTTRPTATPLNSNLRFGIGGIERSIEEKHRATDESINAAFQDLTNLMEKAKDMVTLSKNIANKIREKQGDISEDDTVRFKSYLLSLGIDDPVTRDGFRSDSEYYMGLAQQIADIMVAQLADCGSIMSLADVWCRVNRARGLELISPEDLMNACKLLPNVQAEMFLRKLPSGAWVLQSNTHSDDEMAKKVLKLLEEHKVLTPMKMSQVAPSSILLASERLLITENMGLVCRDESIEGLAFYPNLFLKEEA
ncbi:hypothetical protein ACJJTC_017698 [Scirpophaga incertulas]